MICMDAMGSMITNVHKSRCRQYSKASLNGQVTQNWAMMVINAMARMYNDEISLYQDEVTDHGMVAKWWIYHC